MATVIGITAAKAAQIENASVTGGYINEHGYLILTTKGGEEINAGWTLNDISDLENEIDGVKLQLPIIHQDLLNAWAELDTLKAGTHPIFEQIDDLLETVKDGTVTVHRTPTRPTDLNDTSDIADIWVNPNDPSDVWQWEGSERGWVRASADLSEFYTRMDEAETALTNLKDVELPALRIRLNSIDTWVEAAEGDLETIDNRIGNAVTTASTGLQGMISDAQAAAAEDASSKASEALAEALALATQKGRIWRQDTPPSAGHTFRWTGAEHISASEEWIDNALTRRNRVVNSSFENATADGWQAVYGSLALYVRGTQWGGGHGARLLLGVADGSNSQLLVRPNTAIAHRYPVVGGQWVAAQTWLAQDSSIAAGLRFQVVFHDSTGNSLSMATTTRKVVPFYQGGMFNLVVQAPAGAATYRIEVSAYSGDTTPIPSGLRIWLDSPMTDTFSSKEDAEAYLQLGYFDGSFPDERTNDLWIDTTSVTTVINGQSVTAPGNVFKTWDGSGSWVSVESKAVKDAMATAVIAKESADGKSTVTYGASKKGTNDSGARGDTHYTISGGNVVAIQQRTGTIWTDVELTHTTIASINLGKGVFGELDGIHLKSNSIFTDKLVIGDTGNLIADVAHKPGAGTDPHVNPGASHVSIFTTLGDTTDENRGIHLWAVTRQLTQAERNAGVDNWPSRFVLIHLAGTNGSRSIPVEGGKEYRLGAGFRLGGSYPDGIGEVEWAIREHDKDGVQLAYRVVSGAPHGALMQPNWTTREHWATFVASTGTATVMVELRASKPNAGFRIFHPYLRQMNAGELIIDGTLTGNKFKAKSIFANQLAIGAGSNLLSDPDFMDNGALWYASSGTWTYDAGNGMGGKPSMHSSGGSGQVGIYFGLWGDRDRLTPVIEGETYRLSAWIRTEGTPPAKSISIYARTYTNSGSQGIHLVAQNKANTAMSQYYRLDGLFTVPTGVTRMSMGVFSEPGYVGAIRFTQPAINLATDGSLVVENSIFARHIDVGDLKAELIKTDMLTAIIADIDDLYADLARFETAEIEVARITGLTYTTAQGRFLNSELIAANSILADKLIVSSTANLFPNYDNLGKPGDTSMLPIAGYGINATHPSIWAQANADGHGGGRRATHTFMLTKGERYRFSVDVQASVANTRFYTQMVYMDAANPNFYMHSNQIAPTSFGTFTFEFVAQSTGEAYLNIFSNHTNGSPNLVGGTPGFQWFRAPRLLRMGGGELIVDGSILGDKITAEDIFNKSFKGSSFVLADGNGEEYINFKPIDPLFKNPSIAQFGSGADEIRISNNGVISGRHVAFDTVQFGGSSMEEWMAKSALGVVARSAYGNLRNSFTMTTEQGITEIRFQTPPGPKREYRIQASNLGIPASSASAMRFRIWMTINGARPAPNTGVTGTNPTAIWEAPLGSTDQSFDFSREYAIDGDTDVRILLTISPRSGTGAWQLRTGAELSVIDEGPFIERTGVAVAGASATTNPVETFTKTWDSNWSRSYMGNNAPRNVEDGNLYQGQTTYWTAGGIQRSLIGFPTTIQTALSGATIHKLEVYLRFTHWHAGAGGTAVLGSHAHTSRPATYSHSQESVLSVPNWQRGEGRWVTLPSSQHAAFANGTRRGITLFINSTNSTYYGYAAPAVKFRATYTK